MMRYNIDKLVFELVNKHKTKDPLQIAKQENIEVHFLNFTNTKGVFLNVENRKFILINRNLNDIEQAKIVVSHELGHALMHCNELESYNENKDIMELEANTFAYRLLTCTIPSKV